MTIKLPKNIALSIEHNEHKIFYQTVQEYFSNVEWIKDWISEEDYEKCVEYDEIWCIRWYPQSPIGFQVVFSYSFENCLKLINALDT